MKAFINPFLSIHMQAIILAGGFGTRLKSMVTEVCKPMAPVGGRPFLAWLLEYMSGQGVTDVVLCLHHIPEAIQSYFGAEAYGIRLRYVVEDKPLGTGGAVRNALCHLDTGSPVFVLNGDSLVMLNYQRMLQAHLQSGRPITLASCRVNDCRRYSELTLKDGNVLHYALYGEPHAGDISVGLYVLSPALFDDTIIPVSVAPTSTGFAECDAFSLERDFLASMIPRLKPVAYREVGYFIDIGVPEDYRRAQEEIPSLFDVQVAA